MAFIITGILLLPVHFNRILFVRPEVLVDFSLVGCRNLLGPVLLRLPSGQYAARSVHAAADSGHTLDEIGGKPARFEHHQRFLALRGAIAA